MYFLLMKNLLNQTVGVKSVADLGFSLRGADPVGSANGDSENLYVKTKESGLV